MFILKLKPQYLATFDAKSRLVVKDPAAGKIGRCRRRRGSRG